MNIVLVNALRFPCFMQVLATPIPFLFSPAFAFRTLPLLDPLTPILHLPATTSQNCHKSIINRLCFVYCADRLVRQQWGPRVCHELRAVKLLARTASV
jgi:hypothetical protein